MSAASTAATDVLLQASALVGALAVLLGAVWWFVGPRVRAFLTQVSQGTELARQQLDPDSDDDNAASHARHAAEAADAAAEALPALQEQVAANVRRLTALTLTMGQLQQHDLPTRVQKLEETANLLDVAQRNVEQRVSGVEQAVITDLGRPRPRE